jgi:hypothetical protein
MTERLGIGTDLGLGSPVPLSKSEEGSYIDAIDPIVDIVM